jgi:hypothetical protein
VHTTFPRLLRLEANMGEEMTHNKFLSENKIKIYIGNMDKEV